MAMKLSIFTTSYNHKLRGEHYKESISQYKALADEVVEIDDPWPEEFSWEFIGQQFQKGYEAASGDWVIRMDLDTVFHEYDFNLIRRTLEKSQIAVVGFHKRQFIIPDRFNLKSRLLLAVNKRYCRNHIRFNGGGDLCQMTFDNQELRINDAAKTEIPIWNYECLLKTKDQIKKDKGRFARAWQRRFGEYRLGGPDDDSAYEKWWEMVSGRYNKHGDKVNIEQHPKVMQKLIKKLKPDQFGFDGFGLKNA